MTNKEALEKLVYLSTTNEEKPNWLMPEIAELNKIIKQDLETLEMLLSCFKRYILEATSNGYRRGDNIIADLLRDKLGLIKLNELKRRLENE